MCFELKRECPIRRVEMDDVLNPVFEMHSLLPPRTEVSVNVSDG